MPLVGSVQTIRVSVEACQSWPSWVWAWRVYLVAFEIHLLCKFWFAKACDPAHLLTAQGLGVLLGDWHRSKSAIRVRNSNNARNAPST